MYNIKFNINKNLMSDFLFYSKNISAVSMHSLVPEDFPPKMLILTFPQIPNTLHGTFHGIN